MGSCSDATPRSARDSPRRCAPGSGSGRTRSATTTSAGTAGLPARARGDEISLAGRIVAVADVFDVITSARSYKEPGIADRRARGDRALRRHAVRPAGRARVPQHLARPAAAAMGPLSWLAQAPMLGRIPLTPGVATLASSAVAVVGAIAAGLVAGSNVPTQFATPAAAAGAPGWRRGGRQPNAAGARLARRAREPLGDASLAAATPWLRPSIRSPPAAALRRRPATRPPAACLRASPAVGRVRRAGNPPLWQPSRRGAGRANPPGSSRSRPPNRGSTTRRRSAPAPTRRSWRTRAPTPSPGWAQAISPGAGDDASQAVSFAVASDLPVAVHGRVAGPPSPRTARLTYTPAADSSGVCDREHPCLRRRRGTAGGGADTSAVQTFQIAVAPVNDVPFVRRREATGTVLENAAPQTVASWANAISAGPADAVRGRSSCFAVSE